MIIFFFMELMSFIKVLTRRMIIVRNGNIWLNLSGNGSEPNLLIFFSYDRWCGYGWKLGQLLTSHSSSQNVFFLTLLRSLPHASTKLAQLHELTNCQIYKLNPNWTSSCIPGKDSSLNMGLNCGYWDAV